jgi:hypothetical protein
MYSIWMSMYVTSFKTDDDDDDDKWTDLFT